MAELKPTAIDQEPAVKSRQDAWGEMASQQYAAPEDVPAPRQPVGEEVYDTQNRVGILGALIKGVPSSPSSSYSYDPTYKATVGETIASSFTDFARSGTQVLAEWTPEYKQAREAIERVRKYDPEAADQIESAGIQKKLSNTKLAVKGGAAVLEGLLTFAPAFKVGRAAMAAADAATIAKLGKAGKAIESSAILSKLYSGGVTGALYGGLYGLHSHDADWSEAAKNAAMGGVFGAGLMSAVGGLAFLGKYGANKTMRGFSFGSEVAKDIASRYADTLPVKAATAVSKMATSIFEKSLMSIDARMKKYYGDIGENFVNMYRSASRDATKDLGKIQLSFIDNGLMEAPSGLGKAFKGVEFIGNDTERMMNYNQILRGIGPYADPTARAAAIQADQKLQFLDGLRKYYGATAKDTGIVDNLLDMDTYLPKHTPIVELTNKTRSAIKAAVTPAEREAIYAANDPLVKEMIDNAVQYEKSFKSAEEAYQTYYDYADIVSGGSHTPIGDNKMLQRMVANGEAATIEQAKGKIIQDLNNRKQSLTPMASSLDFKRQVDLPWYDPNPARVMPQYTYDAAMRIEMAKRFGPNDEVLQEMLGSIKADLDRGVSADVAAREFEGFVRAVTGQMNRSPESEKLSSMMRALQVPKLAFAQIVNLGQSLNTLLSSDFGVTMKGLTTAFSEKNIRNAIERGVLTNSFIRQIFDYNSGGSKLAENFMKYSGFTYTEMFNRVVASTVADDWTSKNLAKLLAKNPVSVSEVAKEASKYKSVEDFIKTKSPALDYIEKIKKDENYLITKMASGGDESRGIARILQQRIDEGMVPKNVLDDFYSKTGSVIDMEARIPISPLNGIRASHIDEFLDNPKVAELSDLLNEKDIPLEGRNSPAYRALEELDLPVDEIIKRGSMTQEEKAIASQAFVEKTQFLGRPIDLPYFASTPEGKVLAQFKTFAYQQARFITKEMKTTWVNDKPRFFRNLFILSTVFPMTGEVLADVRSLITQEKRPTKALDRYISDIFAAGTYGLVYDFYKSAEKGDLARKLIGAATGDVVGYLEEAAKAPGQILGGHADTALRTFTKQLLRQSGVGRPILNVAYPQKSGGESTLESILDWSAD